METITQIRHTSGAVDAYGVPTTTSTQIPLRASVSPRTSQTTVGASESTIIDGLTLYLPSGTVVESDDLFTVRGVTYSVDGEAFSWVSGISSWSPGVVVDLRKMSNG